MKLTMEIPKDMDAKVDENGNIVIDVPDSYYWTGYKDIQIDYSLLYQHSNNTGRIYNGVLQFNEYRNKFLNNK